MWDEMLRRQHTTIARRRVNNYKLFQTFSGKLWNRAYRIFPWVCLLFKLLAWFLTIALWLSETAPHVAKTWKRRNNHWISDEQTIPKVAETCVFKTSMQKEEDILIRPREYFREKWFVGGTACCAWHDVSALSIKAQGKTVHSSVRVLPKYVRPLHSALNDESLFKKRKSSSN